GCHRRKTACHLEDFRMGELKGRGEVELTRLGRNRLGNLGAAMAGKAAPQTGKAVDELAALLVVEEHALRARQNARLRFEFAVGRERQPEGFESVGVGRSVHRRAYSMAAAAMPRSLAQRYPLVE